MTRASQSHDEKLLHIGRHRAQARAGALKAKIDADVAQVITGPDIHVRCHAFAFEPLAWSPQEITRNAEARSKIRGEPVKRGNISLD